MNPLKKLYCRSFQLALTVGNNFLSWRSPELLTGPGAVNRLPAFIKAKGIESVLLVTDKMLLSLGLLNGMLSAAEKEGLSVVVYDGVQPNPTVENVEEAYAAYKKGNCQAILAVGGGSAMDCAKVCGARAVNPGRSVMKMKGILKVFHRLPPLFAVPTTAGTGSETTVTAVITDAGNKHKILMNDTKLIPSYAVMDPELLIGLPPQLTATTGLDALCHAVESYINGSYNTKNTRQKARQAVRLVHENLYESYCDGKNLAARENMLLASHYAGIAFTRGCVGYVHSTGHTLGGLYHLPHGMAMAIILPHVLKKYGTLVYRRLSELADVIGLPGASEKEKAEAFIAWIEELKRKMDIPEKTDVIEEGNVEQIITWSLAEANPLYPVPVLWDRKELSELIADIRE